MNESSPITYAGSPITPLAVDTHTVRVEGLVVMDGSYPAGFHVPAHRHDGPTFLVMLQGTFEERMGARTYDCRQGNLIVKPPVETHADIIRSPFRAIAVEVTPQRMQRLDPFVPLDAAHEPNDEAYTLAWHIARELRTQPDPSSALALEGLALELVATSVRPERTSARLGPTWLRRVVERLHDTPCELASLESIAKVANVHPVYLARIFKKYYHCSLGVYARRLRLRWAADRLVATDESVGAIAHAAGFYDQSHFSRVFTLNMGSAPSRYRQLFGTQTARRPRASD